MEVSHGFCDFFLMPDLSRYPSRHSYIIELKYLSKKDYELKAQGQWQQAVAQIEDYAKAPRVIQLSAGTQLHKVIMQFEGWELKRLEEV